jgi:hypothetical protein
MLKPGVSNNHLTMSGMGIPARPKVLFNEAAEKNP